MKLFWTETAKDDLLAIQRYIADDNPTAAKKWVGRLKQRVRDARHAPLAGRMVPEFSREDIRELLEGNYRIVYQVANLAADALPPESISEGRATITNLNETKKT